MKTRHFLSFLLLSVGLQAEPLVIKADAMLDVISGKMLPKPLLIIDGQNIRQIGTQGSLSADKIADIIAVPGTPLNKISLLERVSWVIKQGKVIKQP